MEFLFDDSHDPIRLIVLVSCLLAIGGLMYRRFNPPDDDWNAKTKDYWFSLLLFALAAAASTVENLISNQDYTVRLSLAFVASAVCIGGLIRHGRWRGDGYANDEAADADQSG